MYDLYLIFGLLVRLQS